MSTTRLKIVASVALMAVSITGYLIHNSQNAATIGVSLSSTSGVPPRTQLPTQPSADGLRSAVQVSASPTVAVAGRTLAEEAASINAALERCALANGSPEELRACMESAFLDAPRASDLAAWMCQGTDRGREHIVAIETALSRLAPENVLEYLGELQTTCDRYSESYYLLDVLAYRRTVDPQWFAMFEASLTPESVFNPKLGDASVQVLELLTREGNEWARLLIQDGGRGYLGGSKEQIFRAAVIATCGLESATARFDYVHSVMDSPLAPKGAMLGSHLAHIVVDPAMWPNGDCGKSLAMLEEILRDPRFSKEAAKYLLLQPPKDIPPAYAQMWVNITAELKVIAKS